MAAEQTGAVLAARLDTSAAQVAELKERLTRAEADARGTPPRHARGLERVGAAAPFEVVVKRRPDPAGRLAPGVSAIDRNTGRCRLSPVCRSRLAGHATRAAK